MASHAELEQIGCPRLGLSPNSLRHSDQSTNDRLWREADFARKRPRAIGSALNSLVKVADRHHVETAVSQSNLESPVSKGNRTWRQTDWTPDSWFSGPIRPR
jgi:hypothetical protein